jgi:hypothetical protein
MKFTAEDFTAENATRLSVIIQSKMGNPPLTPFKSLMDSQQKKFNRLLNEYVSMLGNDWYNIILDQFNLIMQEDVLNEAFDPSKQTIGMVGGNKELLLSDEQKDFITKELEKDIDEYKKEVGCV